MKNGESFLQYFEEQWIKLRPNWCCPEEAGPRSNQGIEGGWGAVNEVLRKAVGPILLPIESLLARRSTCRKSAKQQLARIISGRRQAMA